MTNKREIKKYIRRVSNEVAEYILPAAVYAKAMTDEAAMDTLDKLSELQNKALSRLSIAFDKKIDAFESASAYNAAKAKYYRTAYGQAVKEFEEGVGKLLAPINDAKK